MTADSVPAPHGDLWLRKGTALRHLGGVRVPYLTAKGSGWEGRLRAQGLRSVQATVLVGRDVARGGGAPHSPGS